MHKFVSIVAIAAIVSLGLNLKAESVVVPNSNASTEGNSNNYFPFDLGGATYLGTMHYQQVYAGSAFGSSPLLITQILFRPDAMNGSPFSSAFSSTLTDVEIDLSTTSAGPDALSLTLANNVGPDDTVVYGRGPLSLHSGDTGPSSGPKNFDIVINLTTPFVFDPLVGNLLLDVKNYADDPATLFDAVDSANDAVSRVYTTVDSPTAYVADTLGLVTEFTATPYLATPEPITGLLTAIGLLAFTVQKTRRRASIKR